ncbi:MAG: DUF1080 domain-containing protein [Planctomycetota bacterium]|nr:MAG: DUF1080 domain-containing protein [Planctomycetota bacterium]
MRCVCATAVLSMILACGCSQGKPLFNGQDLSGWVEIGSTGAWSVEEGILKCSGRKEGYAWLSTDQQYGDFELTCDWRIEPAVNAGIFCRAPSREGRTSQKGFEIQIKDDRKDKDLTDVTGAVFSRIPAAGRFSKPIGEWNYYKITCIGRHLSIELNGHLVSDTNIDMVKPSTDWAMDKVPNQGYIGLQNHGDPVEFRNIRIREIR